MEIWITRLTNGVLDYKIVFTGIWIGNFWFNTIDCILLLPKIVPLTKENEFSLYRRRSEERGQPRIPG